MGFDDWSAVARVLLVGPAAYLLLVVLLRVSGKRTLSKLNAFDLVVTVAMGSTLSTALLSRDVTLAQAGAAFLVLVGAQFLVAKLSVAFGWADALAKSTPALLLLEGRFLEPALARERVTQDEVRAAIRQSGLARVEDVGAVVLETDGSMSVLPRAAGGRASSLEGVHGAPD